LRQVAESLQCWSYVGTNFGQVGALAAEETDCTSAKGTFGSAPCPTASELGTCAFHYGTTAEKAWAYYQPAGGGTTADTLQASCEQAQGTFFAAGTYTPTAPAAQTAYSP
jgi:hypothetical protein